MILNAILVFFLLLAIISYVSRTREVKRNHKEILALQVELKESEYKGNYQLAILKSEIRQIADNLYGLCEKKP